ncbi:hypothetical protein PVK06_046794 [Gossypium arboreum]|uniref:Mutator family transposase n=1 Tax=Gossypium arboreum TaxID=29729 RepID=A0ABR0MBK0_GOSAR|nr:hypothetical protein PVK06_046794 [Gossypium arboreum]
MRELYGNWDVSYNELQGWIVGMQESIQRHVVREDNIYLISDRSKGLLATISMENWQWTQSYDEEFRYVQMTTNPVEAINSVLRRTCHLSISVVFSATFCRLDKLMPRMGLRQVKQIEVEHVYVEGV